jgi:hypothetical protein
MHYARSALPAKLVTSTIVSSQLGGLSSLPLASLAYLSLLLLVSAFYLPTVPSTYVNMHRMRRKQLHIYKKQNTRRAEAQKYRSSGVRKTE